MEIYNTTINFLAYPKNLTKIQIPIASKSNYAESFFHTFICNVNFRDKVAEQLYYFREGL